MFFRHGGMKRIVNRFQLINLKTSFQAIVRFSSRTTQNCQSSMIEINIHNLFMRFSTAFTFFYYNKSQCRLERLNRQTQQAQEQKVLVN